EPALAVQSLRKAIALDPYSAEALLDLAAAYDGQGDTADARQAFLAAQRVYPLSADVAWSYGNFLLRQGEQDAAFREIRKSVELEPKRAAEAFSRALRAQPDAKVLLDKAVPPSPAVYVPILLSLSNAGDLDNGQLVWNRLIALQQKVPMSDMFFFINELIQQRRIGDAVRAWHQAASIMQNPPPPDPPGSLLWDGGFESGYVGGGFSWRFAPATSDVQISLDPAEKHSGERSLRILFNGRRNIGFEDACHNIAPEAGRKYLLSAWVKTQSLSSSEGVRLQIFVFTATNTESAVTEDVHGTQPWRQVQLVWVAPPGAGFGTVCVKRKMSDMPQSAIQGAAWFDDVSMVPMNEDSSKP
ncbi:MAG TPA: tetratricopeptide repeat protein, partial [Candidatus Bathyarchaeia archaeon]|nr:tetratricopeptide repeat protein [Candidatus Bathyarchaeia archaeon]